MKLSPLIFLSLLFSDKHTSAVNAAKAEQSLEDELYTRVNSVNGAFKDDALNIDGKVREKQPLQSAFRILSSLFAS
jgi:hypothetical protein